jgi:hypothetical protein
LSGAAEKKGKKGNAAAFFAAKGAGEKPKGRLRHNDDGDLIVKKPRALGSVCSEERKRGDVVEQEGGNKRRAVEGRTFKPLRVRSAVLGEDAMEIDLVGGGLGAGVEFGI